MPATIDFTSSHVVSYREIYQVCQKLQDNRQQISVTGLLGKISRPMVCYLLRHLREKIRRGGLISLAKAEHFPWFTPSSRDALGGAILSVNARLRENLKRNRLPPHVGAWVSGVHQGGCLERGGIIDGDILITFNQQEIRSDQPWPWEENALQGQLDITFIRNDTLQSTTVQALPVLATPAEVLADLATMAGLTLIGEEEEQYQLQKPPRKTTPKPLVSILIHAYSADFFEPALQSALNQSYDNIEIIIGDDNHRGAIKAIVDKYTKQHKKIRYCPTPRHLKGGGSGNRYHCFEQAQGDYIKYLCDDDILLPHCVETMVPILRDNPDVSLVTSYRGTMDHNGKPMCKRKSNLMFVENIRMTGESANNIMLGGLWNYIGEPTVPMFRHMDMASIRPYYDSFNRAEAEWGIDDLYCWASLLSKGDLVFLSDPLSVARTHPGQYGAQDLFRRIGRDESLARILKNAESQGYLQCIDELKIQRKPFVSTPVKPPTETQQLTKWLTLFPSYLPQIIPQLLRQQKIDFCFQACQEITKIWPQWVPALRYQALFANHLKHGSKQELQQQYQQALQNYIFNLCPKKPIAYTGKSYFCFFASARERKVITLLVQGLHPVDSPVDIYVDGNLQKSAVMMKKGKLTFQFVLEATQLGYFFMFTPSDRGSAQSIQQVNILQNKKPKG